MSGWTYWMVVGAVLGLIGWSNYSVLAVVCCIPPLLLAILVRGECVFPSNERPTRRVARFLGVMAAGMFAFRPLSDYESLERGIGVGAPSLFRNVFPGTVAALGSELVKATIFMFLAFAIGKWIANRLQADPNEAQWQNDLANAQTLLRDTSLTGLHGIRRVTAKIQNFSLMLWGDVKVLFDRWNKKYMELTGRWQKKWNIWIKAMNEFLRKHSSMTRFFPSPTKIALAFFLDFFSQVVSRFLALAAELLAGASMILFYGVAGLANALSVGKIVATRYAYSQTTGEVLNFLWCYFLICLASFLRRRRSKSLGDQRPVGDGPR